MIYNFTTWKLNESLSSARERFLKPGLVDQATFDQLKALDPTPTFKYLEKIIGFYLNEGPDIQDLSRLISKYHTLSTKKQISTKDINVFKNLRQLKSEVSGSETQYRQRQQAKDVEIVYKDDRFLVVIPRTYEASCRYGAGTTWCTTDENPGYWLGYRDEDATLYYIIDKVLDTELDIKGKPRAAKDKDTSYKLAVVVYPNGMKECFNAINESEEDGITFEWVTRKTGLDPEIFVYRPGKN